MSKMFDANIKHYKEKYHNMIKDISKKSLDTYIRGLGITDEFLRKIQKSFVVLYIILLRLLCQVELVVLLMQL